MLIKGDLNASAVTALDMFDMNGEGRNDLLVGRRDGTVQVFCIPDEPEVCNEVRQIYSEVYFNTLLRFHWKASIIFWYMYRISRRASAVYRADVLARTASRSW